MPTPDKRPELLRLQKAFESEAAKFHDLTLSILYFSEDTLPTDRAFRKPNHQIMLWQYYGQHDGSGASFQQLFRDMQASNFARFGLTGCKFSCYGLIEGEPTLQFVRMAQRAGNVFSEKECTRIKTRAIEDFTSNLPSSTTGKPISCSNSNRLAVWLNYVLHHLGRTHPRYLPEVKIDLDPYAGSLSAIDALLAKPRRKAKAKAKTGIEGRRFRVALSFPGEHRVYVASVAETLKARLGAAAVFYDHDYSAELARPNLDLLLQRIYHDNSDLTVVFLCADYTQKEWCGLEWRAIRDIIKQRADAKIMLLRLDAGPVPGVFSIDGYVDVSNLPPDETAKAIERRLTALP